MIVVMKSNGVQYMVDHYDGHQIVKRKGKLFRFAVFSSVQFNLSFGSQNGTFGLHDEGERL